MLGFLIGTACLFGLIRTLRWGRSCGHGWGRHGWGGYGGWREDDDGQRGFGGPPWARRGGRRGRNFALRGLFERLETTPGQEKVIVEAADELEEAVAKLKGEMRGTRSDVARLFRGPAFDEALLGDVFARHDSAIEALRKSAVGAFAKVHEALDEGQRQRVADFIESGPGFRRRHSGGPYRASF
jgi:hypothetical protein